MKTKPKECGGCLAPASRHVKGFEECEKSLRDLLRGVQTELLVDELHRRSGTFSPMETSATIAAAYVDLADQLLAQLPAKAMPGIRVNRKLANKLGISLIGKLGFSRLLHDVEGA